MQGDGTQANPYIPTAWDEFVYAVGKDKQTYVTMPEGGGAFDMNDIAPTGTSLNIVCKSLEGNDWEMRNAYNVDFNFDGDYDGSYVSNLIHKFHFLNMYNDGYTLFYVNISKFSECKFSGVAAGNYALYRGEFERCSMNFKLMDKAELISVNSPYWNQWDFVKAIIDNSDTTTTTDGYQLRANNSLFEYKANSSGSNMSVSGKSNVVHSDRLAWNSGWKISLGQEGNIPTYSYTSDLDDVDMTIVKNKWGNSGNLGSIGTPTELIMGSDGFIANFGGELYRNNFYFSINKRMEHSSDNAFEIRIGLNLKGIKRKVDLTTFCTYLKGYDNFGSWFAVSYTDTIVGIVPHHVTRTVNFQYDEPNEDVLASDTMKYFDQYCAPLISYTVDLEDVSGNSDFQEFTGKPSFKVGNIGTIYDERLGLPIKLKITRTKTDAITGKVTSVTFGAIRQFMSHNYNSQVVGFDIPLHKDSAVPVTDVRGRKLKTLDNYRIMRRLEV